MDILWRWIFGFSLLIQFAWGGFPYLTPSVGSPWPLPQVEQQGSGSMLVNLNNFSFISTNNDCEILQKAYQRYTDILGIEASTKGHGKFLQGDADVYVTSLNVNVLQKCEDYPSLNMPEQYELKLCTPNDPARATLVSQSVWGALRGLETFSQLGLKSSQASTLIFNCTQILDFPRFSHRGILLDTSRHYLPVSVIMENLELMAMNKFNVFHWHIVDDQSFPYQSQVYPDLSAMGAWSDIHIYSEENITAVVDYARDLGIRVIAEFDTPGHTLSWGVGQLGLLTPCYSQGLPDGTFGPIDPSNEANYEFLENLFTEVASRFPDHYIHLGGDEVPFGCWESNPNITDFMTSQNMSGDYSMLEEYYFNRLTEIIAGLPTNNGYLVWEEVFDNGVKIANDTVVHVWKYEDNPILYYPEIAKVTAAGYQALLSSCWYLNYISYGDDWQKYYSCDPQGFNGTAEQYKLVMGGEACMWGEYVDETNLIPRMWPRASAVAERLWSSAEETSDTNAASPRLEEHRCRLFGRGYPVEPFGPSYCEGIL